MKPSSFISIAAALAGFALGWTLKPSGDEAKERAVAETPPPRQRPGTSDLVAPSQHKTERTQAASLEEVEAQGIDTVSIRREQAYGRIVGAREKARLARFAEALGLNVDQLESIAGLLSKHKGGTTATPDGLLTDAADGQLDFEDALLALLDDDQKERLQAFKTRTIETRIERKANADLNKVMATVDLSAEQRETLRNRYTEKTRNDYNREPDTWSLLTDQNTQLDRHNSNTARYRDLFSDPELASNPQRLAERFAEEERLRAEEDIALIEDVLTEQQLAELRASLKDTRPNIFGKSIRNPKFR